MKYENINEITPKGMLCTAFACPSVYKGMKELTPEEILCGIGSCFSVHSAKKEKQEVYLIVGTLVNPADAGLEKKVGEGEALIEVPKGLIDGIEK